jgi:hypothetical protein
MEQKETADEAKSKRFHVGLLIIHPTLDPAEITTTLGLDAQSVHRVGDRRTAPNGRPLSGTYPETRWRYGRRYETPRQWFVDKIAELINDIIPHKAFLRDLRSTGGSACVMVELLGDGYFGDEISRDLLQKLVDLELDLAIECFTVPQSDWL